MLRQLRIMLLSCQNQQNLNLYYCKYCTHKKLPDPKRCRHFREKTSGVMKQERNKGPNYSLQTTEAIDQPGFFHNSKVRTILYSLKTFIVEEGVTKTYMVDTIEIKKVALLSPG